MRMHFFGNHDGKGWQGSRAGGLEIIGRAGSGLHLQGEDHDNDLGKKSGSCTHNAEI